MPPSYASQLRDVRVLVVDAITKARGVHHRQADPHAVFFQIDMVALDLDRLFLPRRLGVFSQGGRIDGRVRVLGVGEELVRSVRDEGLVD